MIDYRGYRRGGLIFDEHLFSILLILDALFMIVTVLLQSSDDDGIGALSGRSNDSYFSKSKSKTMEARLALGTKIAAGVFVVLSLLMLLIK